MDLTFTLPVLWRLLAVVDALVLFGCGVYLHGGYGADLPGPLRRLGYAYGLVIALVAVAVIANYVSTAEPTVGVKVFAAVALPAAVHVLWMTVQVARGLR